MKSENLVMMEKTLVEIMRTSNLLEQPFNSIFKKFELTQTQYNILRILRGALPEFLTAGALKQRMVNPTSDCTRLTDRLVAKGLVERKVNPDSRREMHVTITKKGLQLLDNIEPDLQKIIQFYTEKIDSQSNGFIKKLEKIQELTLEFNENES